MVVVAALYQFVSLPDFEALRSPLLEHCEGLEVKGTLLLAPEGINGTVAGSREAIDSLLKWLRSDSRFTDIEHKESLANQQPFLRMKVKLKKEIVSLGVAGVDPNRQVGRYVEASDWNALLQDPTVRVIDTRNEYEVEIGSFKGAENPHTDSFRQFPDYAGRELDPKRDRKVAMFCTGGIRCEKASSYLLEQGFEEVYHLKGGILKYLETVPEAESLWQGECFVFDNRVSVEHGLEIGSYDLCHGCRYPLSEADKQLPEFEQGVSCGRCHDSLSDDRRASFRERQKQVELAKARGEQHIAAPPPQRQRGQD